MCRSPFRGDEERGRRPAGVWLGGGDLAESMAIWIASLAPWTSWITLTVDDDKAAKLQHRSDVADVRLTEDWLGGQFRWWVTAVNRDLANGRRDYKSRWGHSLFSYVGMFDYGDRLGRLHLHLLATRFPWEVGNRLWFDRLGYIKTEPVGSTDLLDRSRYLGKYMARKNRTPDFIWLQRREWDWRKVVLT